MTTTQDLDGTLRKVQALLAKADGTDNQHEAEAFRAKAEALMFKYRIDEAMLASNTTGGSSLRPVWREIRCWSPGTEFSSTYRYMLAQAIAHTGCRCAIDSGFQVDEEGTHYVTAKAVGYDSDLRYAEMLFTSFMLAFASKMEPKPNPALSDQENAYLLRSAGIEGWKIARALWGEHYWAESAVPKAWRVKARKLFAAEAVKRGEDPSVLLGKGNSVKVFRESYADGFQREVWHRLWRMRQHNEDDSNSGALVLKGRVDEVNDMFYERYPYLKPGEPNPDNAIGGRDTCPKCKAAKSGYCREHQWLKPSEAQGRPRAFSSAGYRSGETAAQSVDLGNRGGSRVGTPAQRREVGA